MALYESTLSRSRKPRYPTPGRPQVGPSRENVGDVNIPPTTPQIVQPPGPGTPASRGYPGTHPSLTEAPVTNIEKEPAPPVAPPAPVAPPGEPTGPGAAPRLPGSQASINAAEEKYGLTEGDVRSNLYRAALGYGDPALIGQYATYHPFDLSGNPIAGQNVNVGPALTGNPNSAIDSLARSYGIQTKNLGNTLNRQGTFFSGLHGKQQQDLADTNIRDLASAHQKFTDEEAKLLRELAGAGATRRGVYGAADAADLTAFLKNPPEPKAGAPGSGGATPKGTSAGGGTGGGVSGETVSNIAREKNVTPPKLSKKGGKKGKGGKGLRGER